MMDSDGQSIKINSQFKIPNSPTSQVARRFRVPVVGVVALLGLLLGVLGAGIYSPGLPVDYLAVSFF